MDEDLSNSEQSPDVGAYPGYDDEPDFRDDDELDEDETQNTSIFSEGFSPPAENDDPFQIHSTPPSTGNDDPNNLNQNDEPIIFTTLFPKKSATKDAVSFHVTPEPKAQELSKKKKKQHSKPFQVIKARRSRSYTSEDIADPEEEKLKLLPDCCEFTVRRNTAFEIDDGRKDMSSDWLSQVKLTPAQQKQLCFSESLLMVEETGTVVGKFYSTISNSKWNDKPCLCVHAGSFGKFSTGLESGTSITSFLNSSLKPLQEFIHEWATINSDTIERKTFIMKESSTLTCKIMLIRKGLIVDTKSFNLGLKERENLITEGSNILLQRLLILDKRTLASMIVQSLSYTGNVVRAKYGELGSGWENVKGKNMKTWGIRRHVYVGEKEERVWDSLYNKNARLVLRCQPDSPQALIPLWFESIIEFDKHGNFIGSYSPYAWACDVELYSKYAVKKEELTHSHRRYILDHPEVRSLLSDYLQSLLFRKPQNVVEFTKQYFESFLYFRAKPAKKSHAKKITETLSGASSYFFEDSSMSLMTEGASSMLVGGEWLGEGEDGDASSFYPVNPTVNYEGLEKVDDHNPMRSAESDDIFTTENETDDDLVVNERGQYIRSVK